KVGMLEGWTVGMLLFLPTFQPSNLPSQDPLPILDRASASFDTVRTLQADFVQIIDNPMLGDPDTTRGKLFQRRPNYFAMRFTEPKNDRIVADGRRLWLYTPSTTPGQVIRTAIPGTGTTGPNLIGQFVEHPRERYTARYVRADSLPDGAMDVIMLTPRASDLPYSEAIVWIAKQDGLVRRIEIVEDSGQRRTITLQQLAVNQAIPSREFRFSPMAGVLVVDQ
ncbi:MAG TPA: outer membrane lipoprotein chaperone LolA, partial [Gemmatimonadales bacterium]|nr:outer membrane lipoprotein chaperone LolA [Gemmatimonadales bacterium]